MDLEFDVHDHRHQLKQLRDTGETAVFENRDELTCPACSKPFARLMIVTGCAITFPPTDGNPFCLLRREDDVVIFRH